MDALKVTAGKPSFDGAINVAPTGTPLPTSATATLDSAFQDMGFVADTGVVNSNTATTTAIKTWGGSTVLDVQTDKPDTFKTKFIEALNKNVLITVFGEDNVDGDLETGLTIKANSKELTPQSFVIDMMLSNGGVKRIVIPVGKVTSIADINYTDNDAVGYEITLSAYPDESGNTHYEYILGEGEPTL